MNIENSLKAIEAWAIEGLEEIQGRGSPARVIKLMKDINSEVRKLEYRGSGLRGYQKEMDDYARLVRSSIFFERSKMELMRKNTVGIRATAQNIMGLMERISELKKIRPLNDSVFLAKSKPLFVEAEKYARSLVSISELSSSTFRNLLSPALSHIKLQLERAKRDRSLPKK